jgi:hypothetical protein
MNRALTEYSKAETAGHFLKALAGVDASVS